MENKLFLIDGHAILHRAYHALPPLTNKDAVQTNAVYGFTTMLLRLLDNWQPKYLAVAFDREEPTFRQQLYTQYQQKRPEMEGNLRDQIPLVHELLDALGIKYFEVPGFEADDVLGTLATLVIPANAGIYIDSGSSAEMTVVIVTGDRDMLQLINDNVRVLVPVKGLGETKLYDNQKVKEEFGVIPDQWVDVKALKGDQSDGYPGVRGIGPKTAEKLIAKYATLEGVYGNLSELENKLKQKLEEGADDAGMSKQLAQIRTDVPGVHLNLDEVLVEKITWNVGIQFMREKLGFRNIADKIQKSIISNTAPKPAHIATRNVANGQLGLI